MKNYPKILIIANNCFSTTNSNGRTLSNLFYGYPKEKLAQFFIQKANPNFDICTNYFLIKDRDALDAFVKGKKCGEIIRESFEQSDVTTSKNVAKKNKRNPVSMLLREMVWKSAKWKRELFNDWVAEFSPDIVLVQAGDNAFLLKLATDIAHEKNIPLIIYNTEGYYFKTKNYMKNSGISTVFYPLFIKQFKKQFKKTMEYASYAIYNCDMLKEDYDKHFHCPSCVIYNSSDLLFKNENKDLHSVPVVSYLGNLGVGRYESLIEVATCFASINSDIKLDVYGKIHSEHVREAFEKCKNIVYKGFVDYNQVVEIMDNSDILVHAENFSTFYQEDLKYAFSTKIADCLKSGKSFLYYAPVELASTQYLLRNEAAFVATSKEGLAAEINKIINERQERERITQKSLLLAEKNHNALINSQKALQVFAKVLADKAADNN